MAPGGGKKELRKNKCPIHSSYLKLRAVSKSIELQEMLFYVYHTYYHSSGPEVEIHLNIPTDCCTGSLHYCTPFAFSKMQ